MRNSKRNAVSFESSTDNLYRAADATSHLFFAYLRSLSSDDGPRFVPMLPLSLERLLQATEYPPPKPASMQSITSKIAMIVETVSPTPFALLRRGAHFQYREEDVVLQEFSKYEDPFRALTDECRRVLWEISRGNQIRAQDTSWSNFEDLGYSDKQTFKGSPVSALGSGRRGLHRELPTKPTTPSWAEFLSSGFAAGDLDAPPKPLLPPDIILPPIDTNRRHHNLGLYDSRSESEKRANSYELEPGELASITTFDLDDVFWWVWMISLAPEETRERKSAFGRCVVLETTIRGGRWIVMEELIGGEVREVVTDGVYMSPKKRFLGKRSQADGTLGTSKSGPVLGTQRAKILAAARVLRID